MDAGIHSPHSINALLSLTVLFKAQTDAVAVCVAKGRQGSHVPGKALLVHCVVLHYETRHVRYYHPGPPRMCIRNHMWVWPDRGTIEKQRQVAIGQPMS